MKINPKAIKRINLVTTPFRAIYATVISSILEVLSLGSVSPFIKLIWLYIYELLKIKESREESD